MARKIRTPTPLHNQCHWELQPPTPQGNEGKVYLFNRRQPIKDAVSDDDGHSEKWVDKRQD